MRYSYVLPDPSSYRAWDEFEGDLACIRERGYDAVELQITDPSECDIPRLAASLKAAGLPLCAIQTGGSYATRGNCLCSPDAAVRERTVRLLERFVDFAGTFGCVIVFGSLQGRMRDEPDLAAGRKRIVAALREIGARASRRKVVIACEPVNHMEVAYHHTVADVLALIREIGQPGVKLMVDTFHLNIEESTATGFLSSIAAHLAHVHLSETNRDVLGCGHWPLCEFLTEVRGVNYGGHISIGVYNTTLPRRDCIRRCRDEIAKTKVE